MKRFLLLASLMTTAVIAADTAASLEIDRKQMQAQTIEIVGTGMNLDPAVADTFWAVFKEYEAERIKIGDRRVELLQQFAAQVDSMTDDQASSMAMRSFALEREALELKEKYFKILEKEISSRVAARFVQVMNQIDSVVNASLSREMPLIGGF
ncbi:MAG: hypothetical protein R3F07_08975 [Opitutaceae bacterium]